MAKLWKRSSGGIDSPPVTEVDLEKLTISSPTLIFLSGCLPGFRNMDKEYALFLEDIRSIEELLQGRTDMPNVYVWTHTNFSNIFNTFSYGLRPHHKASPSAEKFARGVILPLVVKDGKPLPREEAQRNLRNLTFFGYSAGTVEAQRIFNSALKQMKAAGYKEDEARQVLAEIVLVCASNLSRPSHETARFTSVYLAAGNDRVVRLKNRFFRPLRASFIKYNKPLTIKPLSERCILVSAELKKEEWMWHETHDGQKIRKPVRPIFPGWMRVYSFHELLYYIANDDEKSLFSKIVQHALANAVSRKSSVTALDLLQPLPSEAAPEAQAFKRRIQGAILKKIA